MKLEILFLKIAVVIMGIPVLAMSIFLIPDIGNFAAELYPEMAYLKYLVFADLYATVIPFYFALYQAFLLLGYMGRNKTFSEMSLKALKYIKYSAMVYSGLYVIGLPLFYLIADRDDAPGIIVIGMAFVFASSVVAAFASALQKLFKGVMDK